MGMFGQIDKKTSTNVYIFSFIALHGSIKSIHVYTPVKETTSQFTQSHHRSLEKKSKTSHHILHVY